MAHGVGYLLNKAVLLYPRVSGVVDAVCHKGFSVEGLDRFRESGRKLTEIRDKFAKKWLLPDRETVEKARQELAAGNYCVL